MVPQSRNSRLRAAGIDNNNLLPLWSLETSIFPGFMSKSKLPRALELPIDYCIFCGSTRRPRARVWAATSQSLAGILASPSPICGGESAPLIAGVTLTPLACDWHQPGPASAACCVTIIVKQSSRWLCICFQGSRWRSRRCGGESVSTDVDVRANYQLREMGLCD